MKPSKPLFGYCTKKLVLHEEASYLKPETLVLTEDLVITIQVSYDPTQESANTNVHA